MTPHLFFFFAFLPPLSLFLCSDLRFFLGVFATAATSSASALPEAMGSGATKSADIIYETCGDCACDEGVEGRGARSVLRGQNERHGWRGARSSQEGNQLAHGKEKAGGGDLLGSWSS